MRARDGHHEWFATICIDTGKTPIVILGMAFKPETELITGSPAFLVADALLRFGHDPIMRDPVIYDHGEKWDHGAACYFIGCKHKEFASYLFPKGSVVVDPHRYILDQDGVEVIRIGESGHPYCKD